VDVAATRRAPWHGRQSGAAMLLPLWAGATGESPAHPSSWDQKHAAVHLMLLQAGMSGGGLT
jgi:hypothetical protein